MLRCTIELVPHGDESKKRPIGIVEIANKGGDQVRGNYFCTLKKSAPWTGTLKQVWKRGELQDGSMDLVEVGHIEGFQRTERGPYDILYCALKACGIDKRNK
jgi:hypothetical protein